jgi:H+/Cl- antiporter ClcA
MVAGLFAAFAVAATGIAVLRHKADLERPISHVGVEGIVGISVSFTRGFFARLSADLLLLLFQRRSIALSLPLVFLAYSIVAFVTALTLYSFRGKSVESPFPKSPFDDYTRWIVVGVLGGLAGVLTTSFLLLRR